MAALRSFERGVRAICLTLGVAAAIVTVAMQLMITYGVLARNFMNVPVLGDIELIEYGMLVTVCGALGVTQVNKFHICVTVAVDWMPKRWRALLDCITYLMMLAFFALVIYLSYSQTLQMANRGAASSILRIPRWPFQSLLVVAFASLWLAFFKDFLFRVAALLGKDEAAPAAAREEEEELKTL